MRRASRALWIAAGTLISLALVDCSGKTVRLGDAFAGAGTTPSSGGSAGTNASNAGGSVSSGGSLSSGGFASAGAAADGGAGPCERGATSPDEVLWIGDSWVTIPGLQHERVRDLARAAGALGKNSDYANLAAPATTISDITAQYSSREAGGIKVRVLIMDGGTWDTLTANGSATSVSRAVAGFKDLLAKVASDGTVEHIVYYLMPELPSIPGVAALRPELTRACAESSVPCHFLDLQPLWSGHPEYTASDGIQASEAGATVIGDQIWAIMRAQCIAQ